ncbi:MAG TPA: hypothetical protein VGP24_16200 [Glaciihabitans sp.]|nr:hypothetical protein [Glaciihabitans sp.]
MALVNEPIAVTLSHRGSPEHILWRSQLFLVSDTPTPLGATPDAVLGFVTHPPRFGRGWRFQRTAPNGNTLVFDILTFDQTPTPAQWLLLRTYS